MKRTIAFSGSRTIRDVDWLIRGLLAGQRLNVSDLTVVHGGAAGLDTAVHEAATRDLAALIDVGYARVISVPADWDHCGPECPQTSSHRRTRSIPAMDPLTEELVKQSYCPWAGGRRNQKILDDYRPDHLVAVVDKPLYLSKGTADMVKRAKQARVPVTLIDLTGGNP